LKRLKGGAGWGWAAGRKAEISVFLTPHKMLS
jgi:hypothetical protein